MPQVLLDTDARNEVDDQNLAYQKTMELITTYPYLTGILGSAMSTVPGAALAVEEKGLQEKIQVVGTSLVAVAGPYLKSGAAKLISFWDPADAGYAMNKLAVIQVQGTTVQEGTDLGLDGYRELARSANKPNLFLWFGVVGCHSGQPRSIPGEVMEAARPLIRLEGINKRFGGVQALRNVSLRIEPGEVHSLAGEDGSGKSTLIQILSGVCRPDNGAIMIGDQRLESLRPIDAIRRGIQVIYQDFSLFPNLTVAENLAILFVSHKLREVLAISDRLTLERKRSGSLWIPTLGRK